MVKDIEWEIEYLSGDLFERGRNHVLLYGKHKETLAVLKGIYDLASKREEFICSFHDASKIHSPLDFFVPILKLKYGDEYDTEIKPFVQKVSKEDDEQKIFSLAELCGKDDKGSSPNSKKLPVIFIDGMDELLFKFDYPNLDEEVKEKFLEMIREMDNGDFSGEYVHLPRPKGFGTCLRSELYQKAGLACFYGTVKDVNSIEFITTLGDYDYLFNIDHFMPIYLDD